MIIVENFKTQTQTSLEKRVKLKIKIKLTKNTSSPFQGVEVKSIFGGSVCQNTFKLIAILPIIFIPLHNSSSKAIDQVIPFLKKSSHLQNIHGAHRQTDIAFTTGIFLQKERS